MTKKVTTAFTTTALAIGLDPAKISRTLALARTASPANPATFRPGRTTTGRCVMGGSTFRVSAAGVLVLAAAAFTLSYDALHKLALEGRLRPAYPWAAGPAVSPWPRSPPTSPEASRTNCS